MSEEISNQNKRNERFNNFFIDKTIYENKPNIDFLNQTYQNTNNNYVSSDFTDNNILKHDNRDIQG